MLICLLFIHMLLYHIHADKPCAQEFSDESTVLMTLCLHTRLQAFALGNREGNMPTCVTPPEKKIIPILKQYKQTADDF